MAFMPGKATTIAITTASSTTLVTVGQVVSVTPPQTEWRETEVTHLASGVVEKRATIQEVGPCSFVIERDAENVTHASILTALSTGADRTVRITYVGSTGLTRDDFAGFIKTWTPEEVSVGDVVRVGVTIQPSSGVAITSAVT